jgi:hypothetical protein
VDIVAPDDEYQAFLLQAELDWYAAEIRRHGKRAVAEIIAIGQLLEKVKTKLGHGHFLAWLEQEFGWSADTAERMISLAAMQKQIPQIAELAIPISGFYALAKSSTPKEAVEQIIERAETGEKLSVKNVQEAIANAKAGETSNDIGAAESAEERKQAYAAEETELGEEEISGEEEDTEEEDQPPLADQCTDTLDRLQDLVMEQEENSPILQRLLTSLTDVEAALKAEIAIEENAPQDRVKEGTP